MKRRTAPYIAPVTFTRRSVLEWLGKATVVALSPELLAACDAAVPLGQCARSEEFPFRPGMIDPELDQLWPVRTLQEPDLQAMLAQWQLRIDGLVESPQVLSFTEVICLERQDQVTDLHCVEGWSVYDIPWNGVRLSRLLELAQPTASATHVTFHTFGDHYIGSIPLEVAVEPKTILSYGVGGATLPFDHGFPLRVVVPRLFGYKSAKYVTRIELDDEPVQSIWESFGYPYSAEVPPERLRPGKY
jgi:DMSO/TMAO reductase YedYZ molybdopterin-dependent catalytic subunit